AQDVRAAAYHALAAIDDPAAVAVLEKAIAGKDLDLATSAVRGVQSDRLTALLVTEIGKERDAMLKAKDKKAIGQSARRLVRLIGALPAGGHPAADALTLDLFARRGELVKVKGDTFSGSDVDEAVLARMAGGQEQVR